MASTESPRRGRNEKVMDVSTLHTLSEDLAAFLSEVTLGDLAVPVPSIDRLGTGEDRRESGADARCARRYRQFRQ